MYSFKFRSHVYFLTYTEFPTGIEVSLVAFKNNIEDASPGYPHFGQPCSTFRVFLQHF